MEENITRRQFLAFLGISASTLAMTVEQLKAQSSNNPDVLDVAIIGAGAAGLTAGFLLDEAGVNFRIFEAAGFYGGRARKHTGLADFPLDMGGEWVHTSKSILNRLSKTRHASGRTVEWRPVTSDVWDGENLYRQNRYAREWRGEQRFISTTWFDFFDDFMARPIRDRIMLNAQVRKVDYSGKITRLQLRNGTTVRARHVIVTVPLNVLKDGDIQFTPRLPASKRRALKGVVMPDGFKLFMRFSERFYPDLVFFDHGYHSDEAEILFYNTALDKPTKQNILGLFGHGVVTKPYVKLGERALVRKALGVLDQLYDGAASKAYQDHVLMNWSKSPFHRGTYSYFFRARPRVLGAPIDGKIHFAGEAYNQRADGEWGYMHVASRSAYDAVAEIAR